MDVDLSCLEAKINLQTWVVLLDFLGLGAKVQDIDVLAGREAEQAAQPPDPGRWHVSSTVLFEHFDFLLRGLGETAREIDVQEVSLMSIF